MNGWKTGRFKPVEPSGKKGGYRKIPRGEGRAMVKGFQPTRSWSSGEVAMKWHGRVLSVLALIGPVSIAAELLLKIQGIGPLWLAGLFLSIVYLVGVEVITAQEIPGRGLAMIFALSPIIFGIIVSFI
jgi:hypothetical protein